MIETVDDGCEFRPGALALLVDGVIEMGCCFPCFSQVVFGVADFFADRVENDSGSIDNSTGR